MTDYPLLIKQLQALSDGVTYTVTKLANAAALLYSSLERINWACFYWLQSQQLVLGPFQGKPACTVIPLGKGVCGTAAADDRTVVVDNVHQFPGPIACDSASDSEIVIPLHQNGRVVGVLDIDAPVLCRFTEEDRAGLEAFAQALEEAIGTDTTALF